MPYHRPNPNQRYIYRPCMKCKRRFKTPDPTRIRRCGDCKSTERRADAHFVDYETGPLL